MSITASRWRVVQGNARVQLVLRPLSPQGVRSVPQPGQGSQWHAQQGGTGQVCSTCSFSNLDNETSWNFYMIWLSLWILKNLETQWLCPISLKLKYTVDGFIFMGQQFCGWSDSVWIMKENTIATNFEPHEIVMFVQSTKIDTHKNKTIPSIKMCQKHSKRNFDPVSFTIFIYRYGTGTLTEVFLDRVFQECLTYEGEMVRDLPYLDMHPVVVS